MTSEEFLGRVYGLHVGGHLDDAGLLIFDYIDRLLCDGKFSEVEAILASVDLEKLPSTLRGSFLCITAPAKEHLPARSAVFARAMVLLTQEKGVEYARRVLGRLE